MSLFVTPTEIIAGQRGEEEETHVITTPLNFLSSGRDRIKPSRINFCPEHLFRSQWPRSQQRAMRLVSMSYRQRGRRYLGRKKNL